MEGFVFYILKSSFCLFLLYFAYKVLLSRDNHFNLNRKVLVGGIIISMLLPVFQLELPFSSTIQKPFVELENYLVSIQGKKEMDSFLMKNETFMTLKTNWIFLSLTGIYFMGVILSFLFFIRNFISLYHFIRKQTKIRINDYQLILVDSPISPFSWRNYIIVSKKDYMDYPDEIITHELAHLYRRHSLDLFLAELLLVLHWFNPFVWFLKRELKDIHEYQADWDVIQRGIDKTKYQLLLVNKTASLHSYFLIHNFNHSKLKKRIHMMNKNQTRQRVWWKILFFFGLAALLVYSFSRPAVDGKWKEWNLLTTHSVIEENSEILTVEFYNRNMKLMKTVQWNINEPLERFSNKLKNIYPEQIQYVQIQAVPTTPMGLITDVKDVIRQQFEPVTGWKMDYTNKK